MIKSMTGYGSGVSSANGKEFTVEVRSVNHRYSDINIKCPRMYAFAEDAAKKRAAQFIRRGKTDIFVTVENKEAQGGAVKVDTQLAQGYLKGMRILADELKIPCEINAAAFLRVPDVFIVDKAQEDDEVLLNAILEALDKALEGYDAMRSTEGQRLYDDMTLHLKTVEEITDKIAERAPSIVEEYRQRIEARMKQIMEEIPYDESRLLSEVAIFSDRVNVNEEIVRLRSHGAQMKDMLNGSEPVGRKLDFLIQEMNREINTIGSKSNDLETARLVIDAKAEIEKLREQCQNVE